MPRPEPTKLECLSDASFLGELLVLPANVRQDWKVIAWYKDFSLLGLIISNGGKKFYNIGTCLHHFFIFVRKCWKYVKLEEKNNFKYI